MSVQQLNQFKCLCLTWHLSPASDLQTRQKKKWYKSEGFKTSVDDNDDAFVYKSYFIGFGCIKILKIASLKQ